jgi:hypothetical protein
VCRTKTSKDLLSFSSLGTWEQLGNSYAQTPGKTREQGRPERRTNQQHRRPGLVCKTSIPGSNPGGAFKILKKIPSLVLARHKRTLAKCSRLAMRTPFVGSASRWTVSSWQTRDAKGRRFTEPPQHPVLRSRTAPSVCWLTASLLVSIACGVLCGLLPALQAHRKNAGSVLQESEGGHAGGGAAAIRQLLVGVEVALSTVLLASAALLLHSFVRAGQADRGMRSSTCSPSRSRRADLATARRRRAPRSMRNC